MPRPMADGSASCEIRVIEKKIGVCYTMLGVGAHPAPTRF